MKLLLIGNYVPSHLESMERFGDLLYRRMGEAGLQVRLVRPRPIFGTIHSGTAGVGKWLGYIDRFILFPPRVRRIAEWADVVHVCDHLSSIYVSWLRGKPHVVTCHDMLGIRSAIGEIPENRTRWSGRVLQRMSLRGLLRSDHVACVSDQTKSELLRLTNLSSSRVSVIPNALNYSYRPMGRVEALRKCEEIGVQRHYPFVLHVGSNSWYKNREGMMRIFRNLIALPGFERHRLVMVGKPWTDRMREHGRGGGLAERTLEVIDASSEALQALYSCADALVFPSLQEGFGWPIIEAQACGCPVFATGRPPMTEVGGNAAIYFDPQDEKTAAKIIAAGLNQRESLVALGLRNVERFSTERMVSGYLKAYETVIRAATTRPSSPHSGQKTGPR